MNHHDRICRFEEYKSPISEEIQSRIRGIEVRGKPKTEVRVPAFKCVEIQGYGLKCALRRLSNWKKLEIARISSDFHSFLLQTHREIKRGDGDCLDLKQVLALEHCTVN